MTLTRSIASALALVLAGCAVTPDYERPAAPMPAAYEHGAPGAEASAVDPAWWRRYRSDELDALIGEALAANHDLAAALSRIEQARAAARATRAGRVPEVGASASASREARDTDSSRDYASGDRAGLGIAYELDLWGGREADITSAEARAAASAFRAQSVALVLQSDVAASYFRALALKDRLAIARDNLAAAEKLMSLVEVRYENGAASALEVAQQRTSLLSIQAEIPVLEQSLRQTQHALAILAGRAPEGFAVRGDSLAALSLPSVETGAPAALLERRPDVRAAEASLIAANADIGAARAALYPGVNLSASAAATGVAFGPSSTVASLVASLAQTLFDGGRRQAQVEISEAARRELASGYVQAVLVSLREVEDSLVAMDGARRRAVLVEQAAEQARRAYELAQIRYQHGGDDLLSLLDAQRSRLNSEDSLVQARLARYVASADLFKALGGGWGGVSATPG